MVSSPGPDHPDPGEGCGGLPIMGRPPCVLAALYGWSPCEGPDGRHPDRKKDHFAGAASGSCWNDAAWLGAASASFGAASASPWKDAAWLGAASAWLEAAS